MVTPLRRGFLVLDKEVKIMEILHSIPKEYLDEITNSLSKRHARIIAGRLNISHGETRENRRIIQQIAGARKHTEKLPDQTIEIAIKKSSKDGDVEELLKELGLTAEQIKKASSWGKDPNRNDI